MMLHFREFHKPKFKKNNRISFIVDSNTIIFASKTNIFNSDRIKIKHTNQF